MLWAAYGSFYPLAAYTRYPVYNLMIASLMTVPTRLLFGWLRSQPICLSAAAQRASTQKEWSYSS